MKNLIVKALNSFGYEIIKKNTQAYPDLEQSFKQIYEVCKAETMTSIERMYALYKACEYVHQNQLNGDYVECGVWRGGSSMLAALTLKNLQDEKRNFFLYDTYEGMSEPTRFDISVKNDEVFKEWSSIKNTDSKIMAIAALDVVKQNMSTTKYPESQIRYVKGKVEDTIPETLPESIALLRLDTDWYESTKHEMEHLFPLLQLGGVLIIDDYGHWQGARKAIDDYFASLSIFPYLHRIDYTGRIYIKQ